MYLKGFPVDYDYLQGFPNNYAFLAGLGSTNTEWVSTYQDPFNRGTLFPSAEVAKSDKAAAYARLAPAFAKIQADAVAFVNSHSGSSKSQAQATIDRWKASDFPLIQGFLSDWSQAAAAMPVLPQGTTYQDAPGAGVVSSPAIGVPVYNQSPGAVVQYIPAGGSVINLPSAADAAFGPAAPSMLAEWGPWIAGAAILGFMLSGKRRSA